jgi:hypothetical protein
MKLDSSFGRPRGIAWSVGRRGERELNGRDCPNIRQREDMCSAGVRSGEVLESRRNQREDVQCFVKLNFKFRQRRTGASVAT